MVVVIEFKGTAEEKNSYFTRVRELLATLPERSYNAFFREAEFRPLSHILIGDKTENGVKVSSLLKKSEKSGIYVGKLEATLYFERELAEFERAVIETNAENKLPKIDYFKGRRFSGFPVKFLLKERGNESLSLVEEFDSKSIPKIGINEFGIPKLVPVGLEGILYRLD